MPTTDPGVAVSSGPTLISGAVTLPTDAVPMPMPIAVGEPNPAGGSRLRIVSGTDGDDRLEVGGGAAFGGEGNDTFVLTSTHGDVDGPEHLGIILDFKAGDQLDLSQLGDKAAVLGQAADGKGGQRVSIDFDGDGKEDGYVIVHENGQPAADDSGVVSPADEGEFHILPFPMPGDDGVFTILPYPMPGDDGVVSILPYPMPGDGEVTILSAVDVDVAATGPIKLQSMSLDWIA